MTSLFARFGHDLPALAGVFHVAADMTARSIDTLDAAAYHAMFEPKAGGALLLDRLTRSLELDCFVLFSSTTSLWGSQGLAHYAAANQVVDSLAHSRRARRLPALAVNWGTWDTMRLASAEQRAGFESAGLLPMAANEAFDLLERLLANGATQSAVAAVDWDVLKAVYEARRPRPLFREIAALKRPAPLAGGIAGAAGDAWGLARVADTLRSEWLIERVRAEVAGVLGVDADTQVDLTRGLFEMGMDSLMAVELRARLEKGVGRTLPSTLTFNYPNVTALAGFIEREWTASAQATGHAPDLTASAATSAAKPAASGANDNLDALSDDELEERLLARLSETR
jgi:myxalamid-type polyketide synthase MxaE and MxaD